MARLSQVVRQQAMQLLEFQGGLEILRMDRLKGDGAVGKSADILRVNAGLSYGLEFFRPMAATGNQACIPGKGIATPGSSFSTRSYSGWWFCLATS